MLLEMCLDFCRWDLQLTQHLRRLGVHHSLVRKVVPEVCTYISTSLIMYIAVTVTVCQPFLSFLDEEIQVAVSRRELRKVLQLKETPGSRTPLNTAKCIRCFNHCETILLQQIFERFFCHFLVAVCVCVCVKRKLTNSLCSVRLVSCHPIRTDSV